MLVECFIAVLCSLPPSWPSTRGGASNGAYVTYGPIKTRRNGGGAFTHKASMHPSPDKSSVHPDHSNSSDLCSALLRTHLLSKSYTLDGAVGDTYFPLAQPKLVPKIDPTCPGKGRGHISLQGQPPSDSFLFWLRQKLSSANRIRSVTLSSVTWNQAK